MIIETLNMLRGRDIEICDGITIRQPTIGEIEELGEDKYFTLVSMFTCTPFDLIAQLNDMGIDFTTITSYQLFGTLCQCMKTTDTKFLFGDLDFSKFRAIKNERGQVVLQYKEICINEQIYKDIAECVRKINMLPPPKYNKVANEHTKQKLIELAYDDLEFAKRRKPKSFLKTYISRATNHPYFKYKLDEVWDMKVYAFFDAIKSISVVESSNHLSVGAYSGNLDISKINKKEFNWLREVD